MKATYTVPQIQTLVSPIAKQFGVKRVFLFGSYATSSATTSSDIDIRIDKGNIKSLFTLSDFMLAIEDQLQVPVDIVTTESLSKTFLDQIYKEEVLIYEDEIER